MLSEQKIEITLFKKTCFLFFWRRRPNINFRPPSVFTYTLVLQPSWLEETTKSFFKKLASQSIIDKSQSPFFTNLPCLQKPEKIETSLLWNSFMSFIFTSWVKVKDVEKWLFSCFFKILICLVSLIGCFDLWSHGTNWWFDRYVVKIFIRISDLHFQIRIIGLVGPNEILIDLLQSWCRGFLFSIWYWGFFSYFSKSMASSRCETFRLLKVGR